ncbi:MAG: hypothetical protein Q9227_005649 [Pyrenula ochraceoflavens]
MSNQTSTEAPGYFYVLSAPKDSLSLEEYHDWYNHEHGPLRLKLDWIRNGYRYRERDSADGTWMACYDLEKLSGFDEPSYNKLRSERSLRESLIVPGQLNFLDRRIYSLISSRGSVSSPPPVVLVVVLKVKHEDVSEIDRWYEEEHIELLSKIPGWLRSRRFRLNWSEDLEEGITELLAVHDFDRENGLHGPEHQHARTTPWRDQIFTKVRSTDRRIFDLGYVLKADEYQVPMLGHTPEISRWRIDGNTQDSQSPVITFSNSLLTDLHLWDPVVAKMRLLFPEYRFLRYNTRGYASHSDRPVDLDLLAQDIVDLLDHLDIKRCHALIGVSLGGATVINFAGLFPDRVEKFIACDCNVTSSSSQKQVWDERISLLKSTDGKVKLVDQTIARWFATSGSIPGTSAMRHTKSMALAASEQGCIDCIRCLQNLDLSSKTKGIQVPGLCVVGSKDGTLPAAMSDLAQSMPQTEFIEVPEAGHLPMAQKPDSFVEAVTPLLR